MVIVVGLGSGADTDASDSNQNCSNAETLNKRRGRPLIDSTLPSLDGEPCQLSGQI